MSGTSTRDATLRSDNLRMVAKLAVVAALMFGFGYALVPMYRAICSALGINVLAVSERLTQEGGRSTAPANGQVDTTRTITVEFDANARGPWDFKPDGTILTANQVDMPYAYVVYDHGRAASVDHIRDWLEQDDADQSVFEMLYAVIAIETMNPNDAVQTASV